MSKAKPIKHQHGRRPSAPKAHSNKGNMSDSGSICGFLFFGTLAAVGAAGYGVVQLFL